LVPHSLEYDLFFSGTPKPAVKRNPSLSEKRRSSGTSETSGTCGTNIKVQPQIDTALTAPLSFQPKETPESPLRIEALLKIESPLEVEAPRNDAALPNAPPKARGPLKIEEILENCKAQVKADAAERPYVDTSKAIEDEDQETTQKEKASLVASFFGGGKPAPKPKKVYYLA